jgi:hypothetical protein
MCFKTQLMTCFIELQEFFTFDYLKGLNNVHNWMQTAMIKERKISILIFFIRLHNST